jgi:hypothetical protein
VLTEEVTSDNLSSTSFSCTFASVKCFLARLAAVLALSKAANCSWVSENPEAT